MIPTPSALLAAMGGPRPTGAAPQMGVVPSGQGTSPLWPMMAGQWVAGRQMGPALPRPLREFIEGTFGPLTPVVPMPIDTPEDGAQRPEPRRLQYPVGWNIPIGQPGTEGLGKLAPFGALRDLADRSSYARAMLNIRKDEIAGSGWDIGATSEVSQKIKGDKGAGKEIRQRSTALVNWFKRPDPDYYSFASWISALLEERFVTDAVSLYLHPTRVPGKGLFDSDVAAFDLIDGTTIRPLYDMHGNLPAPPSPAYQQYLYGVARSEFTLVWSGMDLDQMAEDLEQAGIEPPDRPDEEFRGDQLWYLPRYKRVWTPYGFGEVEQALLPITLSLSRQSFLLDFFSEGTIPGVYVVAGDAYVTPTQQKALQDNLNALAGDVAWKHRVIVLPPGSSTDPQKDMTWAKEADQTITEMLAMILHIQPHEIGQGPSRQMGLGGGGLAQEQAQAAQKQRTIPELEWLKQNLLDPAIQRVFGQSDLEWKWLGYDEEEDEASKAEVATKYISVGGLTIDEDRVERGLDPFNLPLTQTPLLVSGASAVPLDPSVQPPAPPAAAAGGMPGLGPDGKPAAGSNPAQAALALSSLPSKAGAADKPKVNPLANLGSDKKGKRKKARKELADRFAANLKDTVGQARDAAKDREKRQPGADKVAGLDGAFLAKWRIKYNDGKLDGDDGIVHTYLLRSYPADVVDWATKGNWTVERHVPLDAIDYQRRPGGRDPDKVKAIADSLDQGASMDPVVLIKPKDGKLVVADGYHRTLGAEKAGWKDVPAFIGEGFEDDTDTIDGAMQDESDSKKKAQKAELGVLGRYLRKSGNVVANFRTSVLPATLMKRLEAEYPRRGQDAIRDAAKAIDAVPRPPAPEWLIKMKAASGTPLTPDEVRWLHKAAKAEGAF